MRVATLQYMRLGLLQFLRFIRQRIHSSWWQRINLVRTRRRRIKRPGLRFAFCELLLDGGNFLVEFLEELLVVFIQRFLDFVLWHVEFFLERLVRAGTGEPPSALQ